MRTVTIKGYNVDTYNLGRVGEHNATQMVITPPDNLLEDTRAKYFRIIFRLRNITEPVITDIFDTYPFAIVLPKSLTRNSSLSIQCVAYQDRTDDVNNYIGIGKKIEGFKFEPSDYNDSLKAVDKTLDDVILDFQRIIDSKVDKTTKVNNHPLSSDVTITAEDIGASSICYGTYVNPTTFNDEQGTPYVPKEKNLYIDTTTKMTYYYKNNQYVKSESGISNFTIHIIEDEEETNVLTTTELASDIAKAYQDGKQIIATYDEFEKKFTDVCVSIEEVGEESNLTIVATQFNPDIDHDGKIIIDVIEMASVIDETSKPVGTLIESINNPETKADLVNGKVPYSELPTYIVDIVSENDQYKSVYTPTELQSLVSNGRGLKARNETIVATSMVNNVFHFYTEYGNISTHYIVDSNKDITTSAQYEFIESEYVDTSIATHNTSGTAHSEKFNTINARISGIEEVIPSQATSTNKLADKEFVNSSIATETAHYISNNGQPFNSVAELIAYSGVVTNNDYAFVTGVDEQGNTYFDRYKATVMGGVITWAKEYRLNNSSFTMVQWSAINSGITASKVAEIDTKQDILTPSDGIEIDSESNISVKYDNSTIKINGDGKLYADIDGKLDKSQGTINVNKIMRVGEDGLLFPSDESQGTTDYNDLTNKPSINSVTLSGNKTTSDLGINESKVKLNKLEVKPQSGGTDITVGSIDVGSLIKIKENGSDVDYILVEHRGDSVSIVMRRSSLMSAKINNGEIPPETFYINTYIDNYLNTTFLDRFNQTTKNCFASYELNIKICNSDGSVSLMSPKPFRKCFIPTANEFGIAHTTGGSMPRGNIDGGDWNGVLTIYYGRPVQRFTGDIMTRTPTNYDRTRWGFHHYNSTSSEYTNTMSYNKNAIVYPCIFINNDAVVVANESSYTLVGNEIIYENIAVDTIRDGNKLYKLKDLDATQVYVSAGTPPTDTSQFWLDLNDTNDGSVPMSAVTGLTTAITNLQNEVNGINSLLGSGFDD